MDEALGERFELELFGGTIEKRYRQMRPEVEAMPWDSLDPTRYSEKDLLVARKAWTGAAFQEHRTGAACAATLRALIECRAPLDLVAMASRFPLDEMVHVELCARMAMLLGGGTEILHDPSRLAMDADPKGPPIVRAGDLVVRFFCVGETISIPLLRGTWKAAKHPLAKAILGRIVKDEAAHGTFGWSFLDWAAPQLDDESRQYLATRADLAIRAIEQQWRALKKRPRAESDEAHPLGWMETGAYLRLAAKSMKTLVIDRFHARGIPVAYVPEAVAALGC